MIDIEKLKVCANNLMFDMKDEEYLTLQKEFDVIVKHMDIIDTMEGIENVEPMFFPFAVDLELKEYATESLDTKEALSNAKDLKNNKVAVPKVVA